MRLHRREYYDVVQYMGGQEQYHAGTMPDMEGDAENGENNAGHERVLADMNAVNACTHVISAEIVPSIGYLSVRTYTSI